MTNRKNNELIRKYVLLTTKSSTPSPTCSISPAHSNPKMKGHFGGESMAP